jgi:hypothetical protein
MMVFIRPRQRLFRRPKNAINNSESVKVAVKVPVEAAI